LTPAALTQTEFEVLKAWIDHNKGEWPVSVRTILERLIALYAQLAGDKRKANEVLITLKMAMGIIPTSERGKQLLSKR
jgi:hypothetical protein